MLTRPRSPSVRLGPTKGLEDLFADTASGQADVSAISAVMNPFGSLFNIELPHWLWLFVSRTESQGCHPTAVPA
jgi:hypothetical protein